jgi:hypothetical protein
MVALPPMDQQDREPFSDHFVRDGDPIDLDDRHSINLLLPNPW